METFQFFVLVLFAGEEEETIIGDVAGLCKGKSEFVGKFEHCYPFNVRMGESLLVDPLVPRLR